MTRETSAAVYKQIEEEGLLSRLRFEVYSAIFKHGPITQGECWKDHFSHQQRHTVAPRFAELEARGVIKTVGQRPCGVTGRMTLAWDVTTNLPKEPKKIEKETCPRCEGHGWIKKRKKRAEKNSLEPDPRQLTFF